MRIDDPGQRCARHPEVSEQGCETCNCRECGHPLDTGAAALGQDTCSSCLDQLEQDENPTDISTTSTGE